MLLCALALLLPWGTAAFAQSAAPAPAPLIAASQPALPLRKDADSVGLGAYAAWVAVLLLALGGLWAVRRGAAGGWRWNGAMKAPSPLKVVAVRGLGPGSSLHVVEWGDKQLLLGCSSQGVTLLDSRVKEPSP